MAKHVPSKLKEKPIPLTFSVLFSVTRGFAYDGKAHRLVVVGVQDTRGVYKITGFSNSFANFDTLSGLVVGDGVILEGSTPELNCYTLDRFATCLRVENPDVADEVMIDELPAVHEKNRFYCHRGYLTKLFSFGKDKIYFKVCVNCEKKLPEEEVCNHCDANEWKVGLSGKFTVNDGAGRTFTCTFTAAQVQQMTGWGEDTLLDVLDEDPLLEKMLGNFNAQEFLFYISVRPMGAVLEYILPFPAAGIAE